MIWPRTDTECQVWAKCAKLYFLIVYIIVNLSREEKSRHIFLKQMLSLGAKHALEYVAILRHLTDFNQ